MQRIDTVTIGDISIGSGNPLVLFAGPCVIESEEGTLAIAESLMDICQRAGVRLIFKASYDKANRSSIDAYRGPGLDAGLEILNKVKERFGLPLVTDVHEPEDFEKAAQVVDVLQIPAFLCRQTDMLAAAAKTGRVVNIKKGQFMAPQDMKNAVEKAGHFDNRRILITERGVSFGYNTLITDMRAIPQMRAFCPVVFDATHSVQQPGGLGNASGGQREFIEPLARAAVAAGADAVFMEVHPDPQAGLSDAASMYPLDMLEALLGTLTDIAGVVRQAGS